MKSMKWAKRNSFNLRICRFNFSFYSPLAVNNLVYIMCIVYSFIHLCVQPLYLTSTNCMYEDLAVSPSYTPISATCISLGVFRT